MKKGFTMIELLIVIMLIGLLATVTINSYTKTRQAAELSLLTDQFITDLREIKSKSANASSQCLGFDINESGEITEITADYLNPFEKCDLLTIQTTKKYTSKNFKVSSIKQENLDSELTKIQILFTPPHGDVYLPDLDLISSHSNPKENLVFQLSLGSKTNDQKVLLNRKNGTIQKTY